MRPALLTILALAKARAKRLYFAILPERATQARGKSGATRRARALWAVWRRCSLLTGRKGHARRSRLAIRPKSLSRGPHEYFNRLLRRIADNAPHYQLGRLDIEGPLRR